MLRMLEGLPRLAGAHRRPGDCDRKADKESEGRTEHAEQLAGVFFDLLTPFRRSTPARPYRKYRLRWRTTRTRWRLSATEIDPTKTNRFAQSSPFLISIRKAGTTACPSSRHRLGQLHVPLEIQLCRLRAERSRRSRCRSLSPCAFADSACRRSSQISRNTNPASVGTAAIRSIAALASLRSPFRPRQNSASERLPVANGIQTWPPRRQFCRRESVATVGHASIVSPPAGIVAMISRFVAIGRSRLDLEHELVIADADPFAVGEHDAAPDSPALHGDAVGRTQIGDHEAVPLSLITAWWRLTSASSSTMSLSANRPIRVADPINGYTCPDIA